MPANVLRGPFLQPGHNPNQSPYSVPVVPIHEPGICELILVILVFLLWLYSFYRLYLGETHLLIEFAFLEYSSGDDLLRKNR